MKGKKEKKNQSVDRVKWLVDFNQREGEREK